MASIPLTTTNTATNLPFLRLRSSPHLRQHFQSTSIFNFKPLKSIHTHPISICTPLITSLISFHHTSFISITSSTMARASIKPLLASILTRVNPWFVPTPESVSRYAWLAIFLGTIVGIITQPLPLGVVTILGLGISVLTKTLPLPFVAVFSGFGDPVPWLICLAFFFAKGFIKIGLGNFVGYQFVKREGR